MDYLDEASISAAEDLFQPFIDAFEHAKIECEKRLHPKWYEKGGAFEASGSDAEDLAKSIASASQGTLIPLEDAAAGIQETLCQKYGKNAPEKPIRKAVGNQR